MAAFFYYLCDFLFLLVESMFKFYSIICFDSKKDIYLLAVLYYCSQCSLIIVQLKFPVSKLQIKIKTKFVRK